MGEAPVFWMTDPEADAIKSPFVRQPHYNDLENRVRDLEAGLVKMKEARDLSAIASGTIREESIAKNHRIADLESALRRLRRWAILNIAVTPANDADLSEWRATMHDVDSVLS